MTNVKSKVATYYARREEYEQAKALSDSCYGAMKTAENELVDAMIDEGTRSIGLDDGTNVSLRKSLTISVTKDNFDAIRTWLRDTVGDDTDYVEEVVSKSPLLDLVKTMDEADVPEFLRLNTRPNVNVRGWTKRN